MDRSDEFTRVVQLFQSIDHRQKGEEERARKLENETAFMRYATRISSNLDGNDILVRRMNKLTTMKEFSNDPTVAMQEISEIFEGKVVVVQQDLERLKSESEAMKGQRQQQQSIQHRQLVQQFLQKQLSSHINAFKVAVQTHADHIALRNKRISKYGHGAASSGAAAAGGMNNPGTGGSVAAVVDGSKYAMFGGAGSGVGGVAVQKHRELRNRRGGGGGGDTIYVKAGDNNDNSTNYSDKAAAATGDSSSSSSSGYAESNGAIDTTGSEGSLVHRKNALNSSAAINSHGRQPAEEEEDDYDRQKKYQRKPSNNVTSSIASSMGWGGSGSRGRNINSSLPQQQQQYSLLGGSSGGGGSSSSSSSGQQQQQQYQATATVSRSQDASRLRAAQQAETSIQQMGQLFAQMATLVQEQGEVVARIEDDVEAGLQDTLEAQQHLVNVQEITKGNRALILKIFALLVFFIFLFLVWT